MNKFSNLSLPALKSNIAYANAVKDYQLASSNLDVIIEPKTNAFISMYNKAIADIDARQAAERQKKREFELNYFNTKEI